MDFANAMMMRGIAEATGQMEKIFDWDKAAELIRTVKPTTAEAGLVEDFGCTGGIIYEDGEIVKDAYAHLSSIWATPGMYMDDVWYDCYVTEDRNPKGWDCDTMWPQSAVRIIQEEDLK